MRGRPSPDLQGLEVPPWMIPVLWAIIALMSAIVHLLTALEG